MNDNQHLDLVDALSATIDEPESLCEPSTVGVHGHSEIEPVPIGPNQVDLHLNTALLELHLQARPSTAQIAELTAKVEMLTALFNQSNTKLEVSLQRIGYLEAKLEEARGHLSDYQAPKASQPVVARRRRGKGRRA